MTARTPASGPLGRQARTVALLFLAVLAGAGCATDPSRRPVPETVTVDPDNPKRVRFVVHGDPGLKKYPEIQALPLAASERIREGMRRHAADLLAERGWCPHGFTGPAIVWAYEYARLTSHFFVECTE